MGIHCGFEGDTCQKLWSIRDFQSALQKRSEIFDETTDFTLEATYQPSAETKSYHLHTTNKPMSFVHHGVERYAGSDFPWYDSRRFWDEVHTITYQSTTATLKKCLKE